MIFVTVGAQMPFDRLIRAVDDWAFESSRTDVFAQIGEDAWKPRHIEWSEFVEPDLYKRKVAEADVLVAHAGTGSILSALTIGKPILVLPRRAQFNETRNDHQVGTAERFADMASVLVADDESEVGPRLDELLRLATGEPISSSASSELIDALRNFISR